MQRIAGAIVPLVAAVAAFFCAGIILLSLGTNPWDGFTALIDGAFGDVNSLSQTAVRATPLLLVGAGISISFRASVINIGGEGQIVAGALLSTVVALTIPDVPRPLLIPIVMLAGVIGGGLWGAIPGVLKAYSSVNEVLSTIMLNIVAVQFLNFMLRSPLIDPMEVEAGTRIPQTERLSENATLPNLIDGTRLHLGVPIAIAAAFVAFVVLWHTPLGFRLRAVGFSPTAAKAAGIPVKRSIVSALALSGAMGGLAGAILVFGSEGQRLITDGTSTGFTGSAGFNGIVAALFGGLHPLWTIPSSFFFGGLLTGATNLQRALQVPSAMAVALNGIVVIFVVSSGRFRDRINSLVAARREFAAATTDDPPGTSDPEASAVTT